MEFPRTGHAPVSAAALQFDVAIFGNQPVPTIVRQARLAESLGYGGVLIIDSQLICRELYVTMTACALGTDTIRIRTENGFPALNELDGVESAQIQICCHSTAAQKDMNCCQFSKMIRSIASAGNRGKRLPQRLTTSGF